MGIKARVFHPISNVSLEDLVPADHFYRHVERTLDLTFVRDLVCDRYSAFGRPSIDPVVFFKLQFVRFFEGMRSERQLERVGADRLSVRWYLGYDLHEPLPDHSSMTRIRDRYGVTIFRQFFEASVERCRDAGLVWGKELYADGTLVEANADRDKMLPRFAVEAHLQQLFGDAYSSPAVGDGAAPSTVTTEPARADSTEPSRAPEGDLGVKLPPERRATLAAQNQTRQDWYARNGEPNRSIKRGG
jgi:transposase